MQLLNRAIASLLWLAADTAAAHKPPMKRRIGSHSRALLQANNQSDGVFVPSPAIASDHHGDDKSFIISLVIIIGALVVLLLFLYWESRKEKRRQNVGGSSTPSQPSEAGQQAAAEANGDSQLVLVPGARQIQTKLAVVQKHEARVNDLHEAVETKSPSESRKLITLQEGWPLFDMDDLLRCSAEPLGMGIFGSVYKVKQVDLPTIVIKHLQDGGISHQEFKNRIGELAKLNHTNVLPIVAYFFSQTEKLLLYEYLSLGNLSIHLHGEEATPLKWADRAGIALDVARGIAYIHSKGRNKGLVHGNIKPSNVVLRSDFTACVMDFGLTQLLKTAASAKAAACNIGYRAPEVAENRHFTHKSDVYSYGVLLLELLTGKQPLTPSTKQVLDLPSLIHASIHEEWTAEIFDPKIPQRAQYEEEMVHMLKIAMECVQAAPQERPSMARVVGMIKMVREFEDHGGSIYSDISTPSERTELDFV